jgi:hypothetical protein
LRGRERERETASRVEVRRKWQKRRTMTGIGKGGHCSSHIYTSFLFIHSHGIFLPSEIEIASQRGTRAPKTLGSLYSLGEGD